MELGVLEDRLLIDGLDVGVLSGQLLWSPARVEAVIAAVASDHQRFLGWTVLIRTGVWRYEGRP